MWSHLCPWRTPVFESIKIGHSFWLLRAFCRRNPVHSHQTQNWGLKHWYTQEDLLNFRGRKKKTDCSMSRTRLFQPPALISDNRQKEVTTKRPWYYTTDPQPNPKHSRICMNYLNKKSLFIMKYAKSVPKFIVLFLFCCLCANRLWFVYHSVTKKEYSGKFLFTLGNYLQKINKVNKKNVVFRGVCLGSCGPKSKIEEIQQILWVNFITSYNKT